jgi:hypothetical protein
MQKGNAEGLCALCYLCTYVWRSHMQRDPVYLSFMRTRTYVGYKKKGDRAVWLFINDTQTHKTCIEQLYETNLLMYKRVVACVT